MEFDIFQLPKAIVRDFSTFILPPVAASNQCRACSNLLMSSVLVKNRVTSSAYAIIVVLVCHLPIFIQLMFLSMICIMGFKYREYRRILSGHPCLTDLFIGTCRDLNPFINISELALSYKLIIR